MHPTLRFRSRTAPLRRAAPLLLPVLVACGGDPGDAPADGPGGAANAPPADPDVELVGTGTVSSEHPEFAAALSPSGDTLWFNRTSADRTRIELYWTVRTGEGWSEPTLFPPTVGTTAWDPFVERDGSRLWVTTERTHPERSHVDLDLAYLERTRDGWSELRIAPPPVRSDSAEVFNSLTRDGLMVFASYRGDGIRRIWSTRRDDRGRWSDPEPLDLGVGPEASNPALAPDGSFLVLALTEEGRAPDLAVWCRTGAGAWRRGAPLPDEINTPWVEFAPAVTDDHLWFTSERPGVVRAWPDSARRPGDLYRTDVAVARAACPGSG
jgi:hypothetical protein